MVTLNKLKLTLCAGLAVAGMILPSSVFAGTESKAVVTQAPATSAITGDFGVNFVTKYFSRGIMQGGPTYYADQGAIAQPYADLYFDLYDGTGFLNKIVLNLSIWSSLHSHTTGVVSTCRSWEEFDYTPGVAVTFAKNFTLTSSYFEYDSPNGSFAAARALNFNLAYNDADLLGAFALHPHFTYLRELQGAMGLRTHGNYYEVGVTPGLPAFGPVTVTFPVVVGCGNSGFYAGNFFGYTSAGVNAAVALPFIPSRFGVWALNAGATYYYLNEAVAAADLGKHDDFVINGGLGATF
jgi:hypothetical protein